MALKAQHFAFFAILAALLNFAAGKSVWMTQRDAVRFSPLSGYMGPPAALFPDASGRLHLYYELAENDEITVHAARLWAHASSNDGGITWIFHQPFLTGERSPGSGIPQDVTASFSGGAVVRMPNTFPYQYMVLVTRGDCPHPIHNGASRCDMAVRNRYTTNLMSPTYSMLTSILFAVRETRSPTTFVLEGNTFFSVLPDKPGAYCRIVFYYLLVRGTSVMALESSELVIEPIHQTCIRHQIIEVAQDDWWLILSANRTDRKEFSTYAMPLIIQPSLDVHPIEHPGVIARPRGDNKIPMVFDGGSDARDFLFVKRPDDGVVITVGWAGSDNAPNQDPAPTYKNVLTTFRKVTSRNNVLYQEPMPKLIDHRRCKQSGTDSRPPVCDLPKAPLLDPIVPGHPPAIDALASVNAAQASTSLFRPSDNRNWFAPKTFHLKGSFQLHSEDEINSPTQKNIELSETTSEPFHRTSTPLQSDFSTAHSKNLSGRSKDPGPVSPEFPVDLTEVPCGFNRTWAVNSTAATVAQLLEIKFSSEWDFLEQGVFLQVYNAEGESVNVTLNHSQGLVEDKMMWVLDRSDTDLSGGGSKFSSIIRETKDPVNGWVRIMIDKSVVELYAEGGRFVLTSRYFLRGGPFVTFCAHHKSNYGKKVVVNDFTRTALGTIWANVPYSVLDGAPQQSVFVAITVLVLSSFYLF